MARLGAVLVLAAGLGVVGQAAAGAAGLGGQPVPAPLGTVGGAAAGLVAPLLPTDPPQPVTQVVGAAKSALGAVPGTTGTAAGSGSQPGGQPGTHSSSPPAPPANSAARASVQPAPDDGTVAGADVTVRDLLGACVRLTRSGVPARATVVVLDQNLLDQLKAVGLPVERLVVPCPAGAATGIPQGSNGGTTSAGATADPASGSGTLADAGSSGLLAFTGADLAPTLLLASGLIALGIAFLRKAHALVDEAAPTSRVP